MYTLHHWTEGNNCTLLYRRYKQCLFLTFNCNFAKHTKVFDYRDLMNNITNFCCVFFFTVYITLRFEFVSVTLWEIVFSLRKLNTFAGSLLLCPCTCESAFENCFRETSYKCPLCYGIHISDPVYHTDYSKLLLTWFC